MSAAHPHGPPPTREEILATTSRPLPGWLTPLLLGLAGVGLLVFVIGAVTGNERVWQAALWQWNFFAVLSSAGVMFAAVQRITTARWSREVIRFMEGYVAFLPIALLLLVLIVTVGQEQVFTFRHEELHIPEKSAYLDPVFFVVRTIGVFALLTILSLWFVYTSVRLDVGITPEAGAGWARGLRERMRRGFRDERRELHSTHSLQGKLAVVLALVFGYGWVVLAFDLSMSLDLHFQSTLYGWWFFMGGWLSALLLFALLVITWRSFLGRTRLITEQHFHDIGKLCFAFTAFWGYLTFSQFLIIWYGNLPEFTHWFYRRLSGAWIPATLAAAILTFLIPFFGLMSRAAKVFLPTLALFATVGLLGIWTTRYVEIYPSIYKAVPVLPFGLWEIGVFAMYVGLWGLSYVAFMNAFPRMRVFMMTSPHRDEVQVPVDPETMEPLPAHE